MQAVLIAVVAVGGSQVFKLNIVMTAIAILAVISSVMYLIVYRIEAAIARRYG